MYLEACFGLLSVCLPALFGALKLKGVQTFIDGFSMILSNLSRASVRSRGSGSPERRGNGSLERRGSSQSRLTPDDPVLVPKLNQDSITNVEAGIELSPFPKQTDILVTNSVDQYTGKR